MSTMGYTLLYRRLSCCECGLMFAVPTEWEVARRDDHRTFWCPNGHQQGFYGPSDVERERDEFRAKLNSEKRNAQWHRDRAERARAEAEFERRRAAALKGHATRLRNRIGRGRCPFCSEEFPAIADHINECHGGADR